MENKHIYLAALTFGIFVIFSSSAQAVSKRVSSPNVSQGLAADIRGSYAFDEEGDDDFRNNIQFKHGLNDKFRISFDTDFAKKRERMEISPILILNFVIIFFETIMPRSLLVVGVNLIMLATLMLYLLLCRANIKQADGNTRQI